MKLEEVKRNLQLYLNVRYMEEIKSKEKEKQIIQNFLNDWYEVEKYCQEKEEER